MEEAEDFKCVRPSLCVRIKIDELQCVNSSLFVCTLYEDKSLGLQARD